MNTTSPDATAQKTAADAATPSEAPTATSPATVARDATTSLAEPVSETSRRIARAILSTLTPYAASSVLSALAGLAHAIIAAASTLRHASGEPARHAASTTLDAAACDAIDSLDGTASSAAYAVCAAWWFATPCDVVASFWRSDDARANTEAQALGALAEVDVMRREVSQNDPSAAVRYVEGLPFPAVRLADGSTLVNPEALQPLARGREEGLASRVGRALYFADPSSDGFADVAAGLAGLVAGLADTTDAAGLVAGLATLAAHHAARAVETSERTGLEFSLRDASEALDAAVAVARVAREALDAAPRDALAGDIKVAAA